MNFVWLWLLFGLLGNVIIFLSDHKVSFKHRLKNWNYLMVIVSCVGGIIILILSLLFLIANNQSKYNDSD